MTQTKFTQKQISDFQDYEEVRAEGRFNMFDKNARISTGLTEEEYRFVIKNYSELKAQAAK